MPEEYIVNGALTMCNKSLSGLAVEYRPSLFSGVFEGGGEICVATPVLAGDFKGYYGRCGVSGEACVKDLLNYWQNPSGARFVNPYLVARREIVEDYRIAKNAYDAYLKSRKYNTPYDLYNMQKFHKATENIPEPADDLGTNLSSAEIMQKISNLSRWFDAFSTYTSYKGEEYATAKMQLEALQKNASMFQMVENKDYACLTTESQVACRKYGVVKFMTAGQVQEFQTKLNVLSELREQVRAAIRAHYAETSLSPSMNIQNVFDSFGLNEFKANREEDPGILLAWLYLLGVKTLAAIQAEISNNTYEDAGLTEEDLESFTEEAFVFYVDEVKRISLRISACYPLVYGSMTWNYGTYETVGYPNHTGVDLGNPPNGEPVATALDIVASHSGIVTYTSTGNPNTWNSGVATFGNRIYITDFYGRIFYYCHLQDGLLVANDDFVLVGKKIALKGNTGYSQAPHLHYQVMVDGSHVDPNPFLPPDGRRSMALNGTQINV